MAIHQFHPTRYFSTLGTREPCLRIADGDTVVTTTVDADGCDLTGARVAPGSNPQTGPFFIEGARPGDSLAVSFDRLKPNRSTGYSFATIASNVLDPEFVPEFAREVKPLERAIWGIDPVRGLATLLSPATALGKLHVALAPMLGCFGVAPSGGQSISTETAGTHGGNMDYRGFREGVVVYLPVFQDGALFSLGDGHAVQGDGEISGTGIETSFEVQFSVRVVRKHIEWPRAENADTIMTIGSARPLDQAVQHATTEMFRWLREDYRLDAVGASILLGQCLSYEIGNVFDPAYTVVCKLAKRLLTVTAS